MDLDALLRRQSPYNDFDHGLGAAGLRWGNGSADAILTGVINILRPSLILEVGSFEGGSAIAMGKVINQLGLQTKIVCIDTWLGAPEHLMQEGFRGVLEEKNGYPTLYYRFMRNVIAADLTAVIAPLPNTSENAAHILSSFKVKADMIFIDAAHEYGPVSQDLKSYWPLLATPGVIIGDDYGAWPEVTSAMNDFARANGLSISGCFGKCLIQKGNMIPEDFLELKKVSL